MTTSYSYDNLSRLLQALHQKGSALVEGAAYTYDAAGNRLTRAETTPAQHGTSTKTAAYSYDAIYQLTHAATNGNTTDDFTYDPVGNRLTDSFGGTYTYNNSNELTAYPAYSWTYDNNGNTTSETVSGPPTAFIWDFENRLTSWQSEKLVSQNPPTYQMVEVDFKYDPFGRRIEKVSSNGTAIYVYDGDNMVEQLNSSGTATARYTQGLGIDEPMEVYEGGKSYYYQADGLGSIVALTKSTGTAANTYFGYNTFGGMPNPSETVSNPFRFTAREFDSETGLYYYRARYYDSLFGRFLIEDRAKHKASLNFYTYAANDPVSLTDPFGFSPRCQIVSNIKLFSYTYTGATHPVSDWRFTGDVFSEGGPDNLVPATTLICKWEREIAKETWERIISYVKLKCASDGCPQRTWYEYGLASKRERLKTSVERDEISTTILAPAADADWVYQLYCLEHSKP